MMEHWMNVCGCMGGPARLLPTTLQLAVTTKHVTKVWYIKCDYIPADGTRYQQKTYNTPTITHTCPKTHFTRKMSENETRVCWYA